MKDVRHVVTGLKWKPVVLGSHMDPVIINVAIFVSNSLAQ